jgi:hypothetical protein
MTRGILKGIPNDIPNVAYYLDGENYYQVQCSLYANNIWLNYMIVTGGSNGRSEMVHKR